MHIPFCDIDGVRCTQEDLRYIKIVKVDKEGNEKPVMTEREVCVHCAEKVKAYIEQLSDTDAPSTDGK